MLHYVAAALILYMCGLFAISQLREDNGTADIGYGIAFMVVTATACFLLPPSGLRSMLAVLPFIWGLRLSYRIYRKNRGKPEDFRYRAWREAWGTWFTVRSFFQIYMLQGAVVFVVSFPVVLSILYPAQENIVLILTGLIMWGVGFYFEARGDYELDRFIANPDNKGKIMMSGLWRYTRHPNYFGESVMWWGIAIAASGLSAYPLLGFVSPLLITYLLLYVSGVPMLEKRWEGNPDWKAYTQRTSVFIPLPPKTKAVLEPWRIAP